MAKILQSFQGLTADAIRSRLPEPHPLTRGVHVLQDYETLGGGSRPVIVGVASAAFGVDASGVGWAAPLRTCWPVSTRGQEGRTIDHSNLGWWLEQDEVVREPVRRALGHGSRAGLPDLRTAVLAQWQAGKAVGAVAWWAKPAAFDMAIWWALLDEHVSTGVGAHGKLRDARTLWDDAELVTGDRIVEPDLGAKHDPAVDALATACACADAMAKLMSVRGIVNREVDSQREREAAAAERRRHDEEQASSRLEPCSECGDRPVRSNGICH